MSKTLSASTFAQTVSLCFRETLSRLGFILMLDEWRTHFFFAFKRGKQKQVKHE